MTGRGAAREHDDLSPGPPDGGGPRPSVGGSTRGGPVAPQPRFVLGPSAQAASGEPAVEVEPTTGAPVDAVPRRVPVRQPSRWHRRGRSTDRGTTPDGEGDVSWPPIEEVHWDGTPLRETPRPGGHSPGRVTAPRRATARASHPPDPLRGLAALLALGLLAAFFAWVSAGPFWLAVGHARTGTVVVGDCTGGGLTHRCRGIFHAADERFIAHGVRISGVPAERDDRGTRLPARMTGPTGGTAYVDTGAGQHLRWLLGLLLVLACGAGIARATGATRLSDRRHRRWAVTGAFAGPLLITLGFLAAAW